MGKRFLCCLLVLLTCGPMLVAAADVLKDPLRPIRYQAPVAEQAVDSGAEQQRLDWRLSGVLISAERSVAIINGQSMQVGDLFEGYKLIKIEAGEVLLQSKQKQIVLRRAGTGLKKASSFLDVTKGSHP